MAPGHIAAVVIGRNEGSRLIACLKSVRPQTDRLVYVDSGSTDGSPEAARALGAEVVALDLRQPFTAARARNVGWRHALARWPDTEAFQFIDGDCEVDAGWLPAARAFLGERPDVVAVCGRRRERHPEASPYNRLCDEEWATPVGAAQACGGDVLMRAAPLRAAGGYRDGLIAGEEPELCVRLRAAGGRIWRLDAEMTRHDAALHRFGQWWQRSRRSGHAYAEGAALHGAPPERHWVVERRRIVLWGLALPAVGLLGPLLGVPPLAAVWLAYPAQWLRLSLRLAAPPGTLPDTPAWRLRRGGFALLGKFAEAAGAITYWWRRLHGRAGRLIEYK
ncbi:MAG TPA: glycosyltransferase family A protein [Methylibium sp.]|nr:glycosyltransferase family A protein [Methylibium sp.]